MQPTDTRYQNYIQILREELVPAMGCTEPIAIAYGAAKARELLGEMPESVLVEASGNIIKNVKSVGVPNTGGLKGIEAAAAAGIVAGRAEKILEVIETNTTEDTEMIYAEDNNYIDDEDTEAVETKDKVKTNNVSDENVSAKKNVETNSDANVEEVSDVPYPEYYDAEYAEWKCSYCGCITDDIETLENWLKYYNDNGVCGSYP